MDTISRKSAIATPDRTFTRRQFIRISAATSAATILTACAATGNRSDDTEARRREAWAALKSRTKENVLAELDQRVVEFLGMSGNCAQSSFAALAEVFGLNSQPILKALTAFPGMGLRGETCGAVSRSMLALGLVFGREALDDQEGMVRAVFPAVGFCQGFVEANASTQCGEILEASVGRRFNFLEEEDMAAYRTSGAGAACAGVCQNAMHIAAGILLDEVNAS